MMSFYLYWTWSEKSPPDTDGGILAAWGRKYGTMAAYDLKNLFIMIRGILQSQKMIDIKVRVPRLRASCEARRVNVVLSIMISFFQPP
jgi:hypothetical protein